jgi:hypothetical protein
MGIASVVSGVLGGVTWKLTNLDDDDDTIQGQFEATELTENIGTKYSKVGALNRQNPILQFIGGNLETVTFQARLWNQISGATAASLATQGAASDVLEKIKSWTRRDDSLGRPPILSFEAAGDHPVAYDHCVIESLGGIRYDQPTVLGKMRGVTLTITLLKYEPYTLKGYQGGETRYHRAKSGDYYEMLTLREYGSAQMGDIIRKRHPSKPNIQTADIIKLPSIEVLRKEQVKTSSIALTNAFGRKESPQRTLRLEMLDKRNIAYVSHLVKE